MQFQAGCAGINMMFLELADQGIMEYRDHWPKRSPRENVEWVGRDKTCRRKFRRIMEGLDDDWPMSEQAAYILRAFSGLQMFPDANHRTGLIITALVVDQHGWRLSATAAQMVAVVEQIRSEFGPKSARRTVDKLGERDASLLYLIEFMEQHLKRLTLLQRLRRRWKWIPHLRDTIRHLPLEQLHTSESQADETARKRRL